MSADFSKSGECGLYIAKESFMTVHIAMAVPVSYSYNGKKEKKYCSVRPLISWSFMHLEIL